MSDKDLEQEKEAAAGSGNTTVVWKLASLPRLRQEPKKGKYHMDRGGIQSSYLTKFSYGFGGV